MERIIKIIDNGLPRYILNPNHIILGKMYDNESEELVIERPLIEQDSICTLIIADINGKVIDNIDMTTNRYKIRSNLSQYPRIQFAFSFSRPDGYIKNSDTAFGDFGFALKPDGFIPVEPKDKENFNYIVGNAFTDSRLNGNTLEFYNMNGNKVVSFDLSPFTQEQVDLGEPDSTKETFVKGKKTSNLVNDGEDGTSPYATENFVKRNGGKIDSISVNGTPQKIDESKNVDIVVPTKVADLEDAGDYAKSSQVSDLSEKVNSVETTANNAKAIAEGKATGFVFDTYDDMIAWVGTHSAVLRLGDNLYIRAVNVPDYWWDGTSVQQLETQKVDLTNYVQRTDYATSSKAGVVKSDSIYGVNVNTEGLITVVPATTLEIDAKTQSYKVITPATLDYSIKVGLTTNTHTLTDEEKANAKTWLGVPQFSVTQLEDGSYSLSINTGV